MLFQKMETWIILVEQKRFSHGYANDMLFSNQAEHKLRHMRSKGIGN